MSTTSRPVARVVVPEPVVEGAGVHLRRSLGTRALDYLDPFLLLDHFESATPSDYEAGFPYHPHRGIETVTLVRTGEIRHADSLGHSGTIGAGDIQWMTSGSGILHEEMPQVRAEGIAGLQLWLNVPAREKMGPPKYRDLLAAELTETETAEGARLRVIAGEAAEGRLAGPVEGLAVAPKFLDVTLPAGGTLRETVPRGHTAFAYVDRGEVRFGADGTPARAPALGRRRARRRPLPAGGGPATGRTGGPLRSVRHEHAGRDRADTRGPSHRPVHPRRTAGRLTRFRPRRERARRGRRSRARRGRRVYSRHAPAGPRGARS